MARAMGELLHEALGTRPLLRFGVPFPILRLASLGVEAYGKVRGKPVMLTREKVAMLQQDWVGDDSQRAWDELGWKPETRFTDGLKKTAEWYRENGWL
jgi:nucleoside-diphosphate-sugar epimerase